MVGGTVTAAGPVAAGAATDTATAVRSRFSTATAGGGTVTAA